MIKRFMKKPIPVNVVQYIGTEENTNFLVNWSIETESTSPVYTPIVKFAEGGIGVVTLEGIMRPKIGDYVVQGPAGEFWFVRKEIFEETYEELNGDQKEKL